MPGPFCTPRIRIVVVLHPRQPLAMSGWCVWRGFVVIVVALSKHYVCSGTPTDCILHPSLMNDFEHLFMSLFACYIYLYLLWWCVHILYHVSVINWVCVAFLLNAERSYASKMQSFGVPWGLRGLWIWRCHGCCSGHCCGTGSIPGLGTSTCHRCSPKKKIQSRVHIYGLQGSSFNLWLKILIFSSIFFFFFMDHAFWGFYPEYICLTNAYLKDFVMSIGLRERPRQRMS